MENVTSRSSRYTKLDPVLSGVAHLHRQGKRCGLDRKVSSVWSFDRPSRNDGFISGLSQYPVFKVQAAADSLHFLRFYPPRRAEPFSAARRYITQCSSRCQHRSRTFFRPLRTVHPSGIRGVKNAPRPNREAHAATVLVAPRDDRLLLWARLPMPCYQHALRSLQIPVVR